MQEVLADHYLMVCPTSIETAPLLHYHPGHKFPQLITTGRNLSSPGCVSTVLLKELPRNSSALVHLARWQEVERALAEQCLGIALRAGRPYTEISGGERQLALIARALAQGAKVCVMDEPANGLDYGNQIRLLEKLNRLADSGCTFIKTTHFPSHALWVSDRVMLLKQGRVMDQGPAESVINQENLFELYGRRIRVEELPGGGRICAPRAMRPRRAAWSPAPVAAGGSGGGMATG